MQEEDAFRNDIEEISLLSFYTSVFNMEKAKDMQLESPEDTQNFQVHKFQKETTNYLKWADYFIAELWYIEFCFNFTEI